MDDIVISVVWFIVAFFIHVFLYRGFKHSKTISFYLGLLYYLGIPILIAKHIYFPLPGMHLLLTSILLTSISGSIVFLFYYARLLDGQTPSTVLLAAFASRSQWKKKELYNLFTEEKLIDDRLTTLTKSGWIRSSNDVYSLTLKGRIMYACLSLYITSSGMEAGG
jgi:glucan phosphoethanolaminetransferase (alkaline phosphatase superfamily)